MLHRRSKLSGHILRLTLPQSLWRPWLQGRFSSRKLRLVGGINSNVTSPSELGGAVTLPPINVGVTADTVRQELVVLATVLNAGVPPNSVSYTNNANGSVTVDFIQVYRCLIPENHCLTNDIKTDRIVLPRSSVREIHEFNQSTCQITRITGYVHGNVICPTDSSSSVLQAICSSLKTTAAKG